MAWANGTAALARIRMWVRHTRYGWAILAAVVALLIWFVSPLLHTEPFAIFLLAVVACARFLGFGPAVLCAGLSMLAIDYFVYDPPYELNLHTTDLTRLGVFSVISLLAASMQEQARKAGVPSSMRD